VAARRRAPARPTRAACARTRAAPGSTASTPPRSSWRNARTSSPQRLQQAQAQSEARLLLEWLRRSGDRTIDAQSALPLADERSAAPLVHGDRRLLALLSSDWGAQPPLDEAWSLARALAAQGRDDRAARLALAIAARQPEAPVAAAAAELADACLARAGAGLSAEEAQRLRGTLLGIPDPWPADLESTLGPGRAGEEWDMEVAKLLEINHKLVQQEALQGLLGTIVESALAVTGAERGFLVLEEDGQLSFDTALDSRRGDIAAPDLEVSTSIVRKTLEAGHVLRLSNAVDDPLLGSAPSVSALELRSILCAPFTVDERLRGVIYLDHRLQQGAFAERAEKLLGLLADQAALAIRQVRRLEEIKRLNRELSKQVAHKESDLRSARAALREARVALPTSGMVGSSAPMRAVHRLIEQAAPSRISVLVEGPSGTGKELTARALHELSPRRRGPFVSENCAAFPESLIESELFGYKKGAFTGADQDRAGLFERAQDGTLFLDEIGELPLALQAKLLRVLETGEVRRVGDARVLQVDFRLVAASNRDLEAEVKGGRFRADSVLPPRRAAHRAAAAVGSSRGHPRAGRPLPAPGGGPDRPAEDDGAGRAGALVPARLARQRARAGQRGGAPVGALGEGPGRSRAWCARPARRPVARRARSWAASCPRWTSSSAWRSCARSSCARATSARRPRCSASRAPRSTSA
jgi:hypothetical protein